MPNIQANDINLYYEIIGAGEPLVFIHGLGSSTRDWQAQVAFFSKNYQVILVDMRGHGKSDKPPGPYTISLFANDLVALIQKLELPSFHLVGISMGGMIAFQLAVDRPELLKSLVVVNSKPDFIVRTFAERLKVWQRFLIVRLLGMRKIGEVIGARLFVGEEYAAQRKTFTERWAENDPQAYRNAMRAIVGWSVLDKIGVIRCPTLALVSDKDYSPVAEKQAFVDKLPRGELVVVDARHALPAEKPEVFNEALNDFLQGLNNIS